MHLQPMWVETLMAGGQLAGEVIHLLSTTQHERLSRLYGPMGAAVGFANAATTLPGGVMITGLCGAELMGNWEQVLPQWVLLMWELVLHVRGGGSVIAEAQLEAASEICERTCMELWRLSKQAWAPVVMPGVGAVVSRGHN